MISALCCWFLHCRYGDLVLQELRFASPQPGQDPLAFKRWLIKVFLHSEAPLTAWNAEEDSWARTCGILSNKIQNLEEAECVSCNRACWVVAGFQGCFENIRQSVEHFIMISKICCSTNSLVMISGHPQELGMLGYIEAFCSRNCRLCPNAVRFRFLLSVPVHLFDSSWGSFQFSCLIDFMGFLGLPTSTSVHTHFPGFVLCPCWCLECCNLTEM